MNKKMRKKAVFFSIISILIVILFVAVTELSSKFVLAESELEVTRTRVKVLNSIVKDMEEIYFDKLIYVSSKNAMKGLSNYYRTHDIDYALWRAVNMTIRDGTYIQPSDAKRNLTVTGCAGPCIDEQYTMNELTETIGSLFEIVGIDIAKFYLEIPTDGITQIDPFTMEVTAVIDYHFLDDNGIASWKGTITKKVEVPVYGLYSFDYENGYNSNRGIITDAWVVDEGYLTEPSVVNKLSSLSGVGEGICSPNFEVNGKTCFNDVLGDHS